MRKFFGIALSLIIGFTVSGCSYDSRIDKASIVETVTVTKGEKGFVYSFYMLTNSETPEFISVEGQSFEQAYYDAKADYIPDLSLSALKLYISSEEVYKDSLYEDVTFMASQSSISPMVYVAVSDWKTMNFISESKDASEKTKKYIILNKNKNKELNVNLLSIFNSFTENTNKEFYISYINSNEELKIESLRIFPLK